MTDKGRKLRVGLIRKAKTMQTKVIRMDDDEYRTMLQDRYGKASTADLAMHELRDLCTHMDSLDMALHGGARRAQKSDPQTRKIWAMWQTLHEVGAVRDPSARALNSFVKNRCRIRTESYTWLSSAQATDVIEILKRWLARVEEVE